ncbi:MAG: hydrogen peroxide-inducible genes activator, partial [Paracoccaceae bacterium]
MSQRPTLQQLRYFCVLAESGTFRLAAERLGIAQPSLSLQIGKLEQLLGQRLVERGRGSVLTPVGREAVVRARAILQALDALVQACGPTADGMPGTVRLGVSHTLGPYFLPQVLRRLRQRYPGLQLVIREAPPRMLVAGLLEGLHDLVFTQLPAGPGELVVRRLFREPLRLAVARDHPLATRDRVSDADLAGLAMLTLGHDDLLHDQIAELCRRGGAYLRQDYEGTSLDALRQMTAMNMGVAVLPALYLGSENAGPDPD